MSSRRPALGRGLSALIPAAAENPTQRGGPLQIPLHRIQAAAVQPRSLFDDARITELADSIAENGILQPILVRKLSSDRYEIIAGERRFRAAQRLGLAKVPVVVREATDAQAFELAIVENVQREDLDPIEEASAYRHLAKLCSYTQAQVAERVGKERTTVANALRLLKLPETVQAFISAGQLTAGHGRALLTAPHAAEQLAVEAIEKEWSVRELERQARALRDRAKDEGQGKPVETRSSATEAVESQLRASLGAPVRLVQRRGKGRIEIRFHSLDELERLVEILGEREGQ